MIATVWFLVLLAVFPDHQHLIDQWPEQFPTQELCAASGKILVIKDRDERNILLYCVEAEDEYDLFIILNQSFNFGGQSV